jgi:hypothetical protein
MFDSGHGDENSSLDNAFAPVFARNDFPSRALNRVPVPGCQDANRTADTLNPIAATAAARSSGLLRITPLL